MALIPFASVDPSALRWIRTQERPVSFSLRAGDGEVATLAWARAGGSLATATTADATWTLKRAGFLQPTVLVRPEGRTEAIARLSAHLSRHEITVSGGQTFRFRHVSHLVPSWCLTTDRGEEILHVEPVAERHSLEAGAVVVSSPAGGSSTLLLVVLTWYFIMLSWFEDEAIDALAPFEGPDAPLERGGSADG